MILGTWSDRDQLDLIEINTLVSLDRRPGQHLNLDQKNRIGRTLLQTGAVLNMLENAGMNQIRFPIRTEKSQNSEGAVRTINETTLLGWMDLIAPHSGGQ